jgi:hypothetical protein
MIHLITPIIFNFTILQASFYHPVAEAMLGRPYNNSIGGEDRREQRAAMVRFSRDLLERWGGQYAYGDTLDFMDVARR